MVSSYKVGFSDQGLKQLNKLTPTDRKRVIKKLPLLVNFDRIGNVKKLQGRLEEFWRYRIGKIRVIFEIDRLSKRIKIVDIGYRSRIYQGR